MQANTMSQLDTVQIQSGSKHLVTRKQVFWNGVQTSCEQVSIRVTPTEALS